MPKPTSPVSSRFRRCPAALYRKHAGTKREESKSGPGNEIEQIGDTASHRARLVSRRSMGFHSAGPVLITMEGKTYPCLHIKISI